MKPPICSICGIDFRANPGSGQLVRFYQPEPEPKLDRPGHPKNAEWFCVIHQGPAVALESLSIKEAEPRIRKTSIQRTLSLFIGTSVLSGLMALGGLLVGGFFGGTLGLFVGTIAGGTSGVIASGLIAAALDFLPRPVVPSSIVGGALGFLMAAALAIGGSTSFNSALIPLAGSLFIGCGFLLGRRHAARRLAMESE
ncbi:MAG: hypothetical protein HKN43_10160 [Rhodothermales bacterium]|nr:hypothetical protein [Rhodothermales bacterium]